MSDWWTRRRFDAVEVFALCLFIAALGGYAWLHASRRVAETYGDYIALQEEARLRKAFGPAHYSEGLEEWVIRDFFKDRRDGVFVDIGSFHYKDHSATYFLETALGWSGIAVDAQPGFEEGYRRFRPRTRFFSLFVSDVSDEKATLYISRKAPLVTSADRDFTSFWGSDVSETRIPTIRLTDLLTRAGMERLDFLSMDIELSEPRALAGFDIDHFRPAFVRLDDHPEVRQQVLDYFSRHGYVLVGRYLRTDRGNLYFAPRS